MSRIPTNCCPAVFIIAISIACQRGDTASPPPELQLIPIWNEDFQALQLKGPEYEVLQNPATIAPGPRRTVASVVLSTDHTRRLDLTREATAEGWIQTRFGPVENEQSVWTAVVEGPASVRISDDGRTCIASVQDIHDPLGGLVIAFDGRTGDRLWERKLPGVRKVQLSQDGMVIAVNSSNEGVLVFDRSGNLVHRYDKAFEFEMSANGSTLSMLHHGRVDLMRGGNLVESVKVQGLPLAAALTPDGIHCAISDRANVYLANTLEERVVFQAPTTHQFRTLDISPDGQRLLTGTIHVRQRRSRESPGEAEALVRLWTATGEILGDARFLTHNWNNTTPRLLFDGVNNRAFVWDRDSIFKLEHIGLEGK